MSKGLVERESLVSIANAIRSKTGDISTYTPAQMADAILGIPTGSGGSGGSTLIGQTPYKLTEDVDELLIKGSGDITYQIETDTLFDFDIENGAASQTELTYSDGFYNLKAGSSAAKWFNAYIDVAITGLTINTSYNFMADTRGITNDGSVETQGHWILYDGSGNTLATRDALQGSGLFAYAFTAPTTSVKLRWYPATNSTFVAGTSIAHARAFYINKADTTAHTKILVTSGSFTDETSVVAVPNGATVSTSSVCKLYKVQSDGSSGMPLKDRKVVCFGDSLIGLERGDTSATAFLANYTGATVYNVGFGGCRMSVHPSHGYAEFSMWALAKAIAENDWTDQDTYASDGSDYFPEQLATLKSIDFNAVDYAVIHYGTNDFGGGVAIGPDSPATDYHTICGALRYSLTKLLTVYPRLRIFVSLPVYRFWTVDGTIVYSDTYTNNQGDTLVQVVEALRSVAEEFNVPVIDNYYGLGINSTNAASYLYDGTHLNGAGRQRFGEYIGSRLLYGGDQEDQGGIDVVPFTTTENGTFTAPIGSAYSPVTVAIPSGASLPSIISALAGGSFTLSESARCNTQQIQHGMAAVPKGFFIWSDDAFTETGTGDTTLYFESGYFSNIDTRNASGAVAGYFACQYYRQSDMRVSLNNGIRTSAQISGYVNATNICMNNSTESFQGGKTYKWLAWA